MNPGPFIKPKGQLQAKCGSLNPSGTALITACDLHLIRSSLSSRNRFSCKLSHWKDWISTTMEPWTGPRKMTTVPKLFFHIHGSFMFFPHLHQHQECNFQDVSMFSHRFTHTSPLKIFETRPCLVSPIFIPTSADGFVTATLIPEPLSSKELISCRSGTVCRELTWLQALPSRHIQENHWLKSASSGRGYVIVPGKWSPYYVS